MPLADLDLGQVFIIVIAVVAGFLQWVWKLIQQGKEERERRSQLPQDPEEKRLREDAWRRQVQDAPPRPPPTATPPPIHDPWSTVREVFDKMKEEMRKKQEELERQDRPAPPVPSPPPRPSAPATPPPPRHLPDTVRAEFEEPSHFHRPPPRSALAPVRPPAPEMVLPVLPVAMSTGAAGRTSPQLSALRGLLHNSAAIRQAILAREILGPPKALQSGHDTPF